jgi:hypothetical protein
MCHLPSNIVFNSAKAYLCPICGELMTCRITEDPKTYLPSEVWQCVEHGIMKYGLEDQPQNVVRAKETFHKLGAL